jgi:GntR family transcriptional regulator
MSYGEVMAAQRCYARCMPATPVSPLLREHAYMQVADDVIRRIEAGEIKLKLPSERALAEEYEVAYTTVRHAMQVLRERDVIVTIHGRGTFVAASLP